MLSADTLRAGILGAGGYTGAELVRLLHGHPKLSIVMVGAREKAGKRLSEVLPGTLGVAGLSHLVLESFEPEQAQALARLIDVAFLCLPHAASAPTRSAAATGTCRKSSKSSRSPPVARSASASRRCWCR